MPQVCGHFVVAEKVREALNNPDYLRDNQEALNLGAIGPDLFLLLFDSPDTEKYQDFFNKIISFYDTINKAKVIFDDISDKLGGPIEDLANWISGELVEDIYLLAGEVSTALFDTLKLKLISEAEPVQIKNPFAGLSIPGVPNEEYITIEPSPLSNVLREFGHPYSEDIGYKECAKAGTYEDWWWVDILHYRRTVPFARALMNNCGDDPLLKAYSVGYFSHVGADICGHPYTNALVGGPFRTHVIRHMVLENISDTWIWNHYHNKDVVQAGLDELIKLDTKSINKIANFLVEQLAVVYPDSLIKGKSLPSKEDLLRAYTTMQTYLRLVTNSGIDPPAPPPSTLAEYLEEIGDSLAGTAQNITQQFDSDNKWWEWMFAPFLAGGYAIVLLIKLCTLPETLFRNMSEDSLRWHVYNIRRSVYDYMMNARWQIALAGWGKPSRDDLVREFAVTGYRLPSLRTGTDAFNYPYQLVPRNTHGFWLRDPSEFADLESRKTECCPYPENSTPDIFIDGTEYDTQLDDYILKRFAQLPIDIEKTITYERETYDGSQFGNAVDFTLKLINKKYPNMGFDLDSDLGYGFLCWEKGKDGMPKYNKKFF